jgi:tetratricopeptide (TPR) repeat protein
MANIGKLRDQARAYEQRDQWREAIGAYRQILESPEGGEVDIALWNRIGDMHLRLNETEKAVEAYEAAVSAYVEVGLYNNAIALCRKILRLVPGRINTYRRLGQISAAKGFLADARQNFLEYADRMRRAGKLKESFEGLKEFADLSPDDVEVRRLLADQLLAHGQRNEAVVQLRTLLGPLIRRGDAEAAEAVRGQIREIDPLASTEPLAQATEAAAADDFGVYDTGNVQVAEPAAPEPPARSDAPAGFEIGAAIDADDEPVELPSIEGLEVSMDFSRPDAGPGPVQEEPLQAEDDLPLLDFDAAPDPTTYGEVSLDEPGEEDDEPLPLIDHEPQAFDDEEDGDELPMLDMGSDFGAVELPTSEPEPARRALGGLEQLRSRVATNPEDGGARDALIDLLHERGAHDDVPRILDEAHRALAARGLFRDAVGPISQLIRLNPGEGPLLQKRVEYAFKSGDRSAMVEAYLALARFFETGGSRDKARAVYGRVLEIEAYNPEGPAALEAMDEAAPRRPRPPAAAPAPRERLRGPRRPDPGRRGRARDHHALHREEKEPTATRTGLRRHAGHFRQKVAENIDAEDSASHYDLGLAFKEMGLDRRGDRRVPGGAARRANPLATLEVLGQCFVEKGQYPVASRVLERALRLPDVADAELVGVLYQLGRSHEAMGNPAQAVELYERVLSVDIRFRDAARRAEALRGAGRAPGF